MPIYEYICEICKERFSVLQKINSGEKDTCCPKCSSVQVKKVMSSFCCTSGGSGGFSSVPQSGGHGGG